MTNELNIISEQRIHYENDDFTVLVNGYLPADTSSMKVNLKIMGRVISLNWRCKVDLFEYSHIERVVNMLFEEIDDEQQFLAEELNQFLIELGEKLDEYRMKEILAEENDVIEDGSDELSNEAEREAVEFLQQQDLMLNLGNAIETSGVVGNQNTVLAAFIIAISFLLKKPLHAIISGSSGMGKSHLLHAALDLIPQEVIVRTTVITKRYFNHFKTGDLTNKVFVIEDFDGLDEEAELALRELQSSGYIGTSSVEQSRYRNELRSRTKSVKSHMSTLTTTTSMDLRDDNESRSIILGIDESMEQTIRINEYQQRKFAGEVDTSLEQSAKKDIRNVVRKLKPMKVVNPYASKINLPISGVQLRRLNEHLNSFITAVTLIHQYQRDVDEEERLVSTVKDIEIAIEILFDSIIVKLDYLNSSTRQFYEELKDYVQERKRGTERFFFLQRDIREYTKRSKSTVSKYLQELVELEYLTAIGNANKGFKYEIVFDADMEAARREIKEGLIKQIKELPDAR